MAQSIVGYKHSPAYDTGYLAVGNLHKLYYHQFGKPDGKPVIFLHGGPGGSCALHKSTAFFSPTTFRVICLDQRGAGKSLPSGELRENTPDHLVSDIDALRQHLQIPKWHMVFGGSWGSSLSLLYAQAFPHSIGCMVLRGVYMETEEEHDFSRGRLGAGRFRPEEYDAWVGYLPAEERGEPLEGYLRLLTCGNRERELEAAKAYHRWGGAITRLVPGPGDGVKGGEAGWAHARLECFHHARFARKSYEHYLGVESMARIAHIPCTIVQGRYDMYCTPRVAYELHKVWPGSRLFWVEDAGHSASEPGILAKLIEVCDEYANKGFV